MIVCSKYHSTRDFSYHGGCFTVEESTLTRALHNGHDGRVYDDACDVGFILVSHLTGDSVLFVQDGVDMSDDEIAGWRYKAAYISGQRPGQWVKIGPELAKLTALIIND